MAKKKHKKKALLRLEEPAGNYDTKWVEREGETLGEIERSGFNLWYGDDFRKLRLIKYTDHKKKEHIRIFHKGPSLVVPKISVHDCMREQMKETAVRLGVPIGVFMKNHDPNHHYDSDDVNMWNFNKAVYNEGTWVRTDKCYGGGGLLTFATMYRRALAARDPKKSPKITIPLDKELVEQAFLAQFSTILGRGEK